ncbi:MAG: hypothetical protein P0119_09990 [Nitrospira sp.]|nr:hypothetical protein [Nitrospira sp.]
MRETAVRAAEGGLVLVSSVALFKRPRVSGEWFRWMTDVVMRKSAHVRLHLARSEACYRNK